jgi:alanyl-tRNA synthetase
LEEATAGLSAGGVLAGETAFKLYDTYGFPLDLTQDAVRAMGVSVDTNGFDAAMDRQRQMARDSWSGSGQQAEGEIWLAVRDRLGPSVFIGHDQVTAVGEVLTLVSGGQEVDGAKTGETVDMLTDKTPFYAEGGGQVGDTGLVTWTGGEGQVLDTQKQAGDMHALKVKVTSGQLTVGAQVTLSVDPARRVRIRSNHSAAHLLHAALRNILGPHVAQKGQLVDAERMRFDFSHGGPVTADELERIEAEVNEVIRQNRAADTQEMAPDEAIAAGAVALFGEKYGDRVRVLTLGDALTADHAHGAAAAYSVELCGGTHVARTGDIALFKIISEGGVAAGIRRIEALTGEAARRFLLDQAGVSKGLADLFKTPVADVPLRVEALIAERRKLEKDLADAKRQLAMGGGGQGGGAAQVEEIGGTRIMARILEGIGGKDLRPIAEDYKKQLGSGIVALIGVLDGKAAVTVAITSDLTARYNAADLARGAVLAMGGQGAGGKPDFAQGGAPDGTLAQAGLDAIKAALA